MMQRLLWTVSIAAVMASHAMAGSSYSQFRAFGTHPGNDQATTHYNYGAVAGQVQAGADLSANPTYNVITNTNIGTNIENNVSGTGNSVNNNGSNTGDVTGTQGVKIIRPGN